MENVLLSNAPREFCLAKVALDDVGRLAIFLYKHRLRRATAERFNSQSAASRKKVEDGRADDGIAEAGKDCRFYAVHGRSHTALGNCQADPAGTAGDHPHGDETGVGVEVA